MAGFWKVPLFCCGKSVMYESLNLRLENVTLEILTNQISSIT